MKRHRSAGVVVLLLALAGLATLAALPPDPEAFPHKMHERLFPVCEGCHSGIASGVAAEVLPAPAVCANCHDGTRFKRVDWTPRAQRITNLKFSHTAHFAVTGASADARDCATCHAASGPPSRMNVGAPNPGLCLACHAHLSSEHLAARASCGHCHLKLTEATTLPEKRIAELPRPPGHDSTGFVSSHGRVAMNDSTRAASCAVCHARNTCERCHANADRVPLVTALARDPRVAALEREREPEYPKPVSHNGESWRLAHGRNAQAEVKTCANCHTQPGCSACHTGAGKAQSVIAALPGADSTRAPGVRLALKTGVHPADIAKRHGTLAAAGKFSCTACHAQATCAACHSGSESKAFHLANFVERHAVDAFARSSDCQSCHSTERFCRDCHTRTGIAAQGAMSAAFHTGQPLWFLSHGQAARRGLESCAACHRQNDCVRCHSAVGGWRINPHGPDFPAGRLSARNAASCRWCHAGIPTGGGR